MSDLISKKFIQEALIERISRLNAEGATQTAKELIRFKKFVDGLTPTDEVEVVRCKDCVYSEAMITTGLVYCNEIKTACSEKGYCYIGERRGW